MDDLLNGLEMQELQSGCPDEFVNFKETEKGATWTGVYLGSYWQTYAGNTVFNDPMQVHRVLLGNGRIVGISNKGGLAKHLNEGTKGTLVQIIYNGRYPIETGKLAGKEGWAFVVNTPDGDNAATLALKAKAKKVPDYKEPPMPQLVAGGGGVPAQADLNAGPSFDGEQMPLLV